MLYRKDMSTTKEKTPLKMYTSFAKNKRAATTKAPPVSAKPAI